MKREVSSYTLPPAVVLGLSPTGLHVVRELGRAGVRVTGVTGSFQAGCVSRYLADCVVEDDPQRRLDVLLSRFPAEPCSGTARPVLIPTSDQDIDWVITYAETLSRYFSFQQSYLDGLAARIMTKQSFYELCRREGVAYPQLWKGQREEIAALRDRIAYPCMIKPSRIHEVKALMGGKKGWIARDAEQFDQILPAIPAGAGVLLLQEMVPGPESSITLYCGYFDGESRARQAFTARKLRQYPPGFGSASLVQSAPEEECREIAERFLERVGYRGIAAAEFKRDPTTAELKMIEVNVRPSLWFSLTSSAGKSPVLAAYHDLAGTDRLVPDTTQANGVRWRYGLKDLYSAMFYRLKPSFILDSPEIEAVGPSSKRVSPVFCFDDPKPAAGELFNFGSKLAIRIRRALIGR